MKFLDVRDFDFDLPADLIAQEPPPERGASPFRRRLLRDELGWKIEVEIADLHVRDSV